MRFLFIISFIFVTLSFAFSQQEQPIIVAEQLPFFDSLISHEPNKGSIVIQQDSRITQLIINHEKLNVENESKFAGWRIQIYNSSGSESRKEAENIRNKFLANYPELTAYLIYQPPFFKIRVGDFRTREEAFSLYKKIIVEFPISYLVNDNINLPKL